MKDEGLPGLDNAGCWNDNIICWDATKFWRPVYHRFNKKERR
jgi:hypothetical protein